VKLRLGLMVVATMAAIGVTLTTGALPALANQNDQFNIVNSSGIPYFMTTNNDPLTPLFVNDGGACLCGTNFVNINGTKKSINGSSPEPVYEWEEYDDSLDLCWTYVASNGELWLKHCSAGNTNQLFWQTTSGHLVNVAASNASGVDFCVNAEHATNGPPNGDINVIACKSASQPGAFDQVWKAFAD
jgi:hypothetical protein